MSIESGRDGRVTEESANIKDVKIVVHWLNQSRAQRILFLLEEVGLPYEIKTYKRGSDMLAPPELKQVHPLGKSPVISISTPATQEHPIVLAESANITEYIVDNYGSSLKPTRYRPGFEGQPGGETEEWLRYRFLMHYAEGSLMPLLVTKLLLQAMRDRTPFFVRPVTALLTGVVESTYLSKQTKLHLDFLEDQLATSPKEGKYFCGDKLSAADIILSYPLGAARAGRLDVKAEKYPKILAFLDLLDSHESYKRSIKKIEEIDGPVVQFPA